MIQEGVVGNGFHVQYRLTQKKTNYIIENVNHQWIRRARKKL